MCETHDACWRQMHAGPLSGVYEGDRWPDVSRETSAGARVEYAGCVCGHPLSGHAAWHAGPVGTGHECRCRTYGVPCDCQQYRPDPAQQADITQAVDKPADKSTQHTDPQPQETGQESRTADQPAETHRDTSQGAQGHTEARRQRLLSGAERITVERWRQIYVLGWTADHDAAQRDGHLTAMAEWYMGRAMETWGADRIDLLTKAAAMLAAEIDKTTDEISET
jgi:hypothetical protein